MLKAGESEVLKLRVTRKDLSVWDVVSQNWIVPDVGGDYGLWIGEASDKLALRCGTKGGKCEEGQKSPV